MNNREEQFTADRKFDEILDDTSAIRFSQIKVGTPFIHIIANAVSIFVKITDIDNSENAIILIGDIDNKPVRFFKNTTFVVPIDIKYLTYVRNIGGR